MNKKGTGGDNLILIIMSLFLMGILIMFLLNYHQSEDYDKNCLEELAIKYCEYNYNEFKHLSNKHIFYCIGNFDRLISNNNIQIKFSPEEHEQCKIKEKNTFKRIK